MAFRASGPPLHKAQRYIFGWCWRIWAFCGSRLLGRRSIHIGRIIHFLQFLWNELVPSGLLPSLRLMPVGSKIAGIVAEDVIEYYVSEYPNSTSNARKPMAATLALAVSLFGPTVVPSFWPQEHKEAKYCYRKGWTHGVPKNRKEQRSKFSWLSVVHRTGLEVRLEARSGRSKDNLGFRLVSRIISSAEEKRDSNF